MAPRAKTKQKDKLDVEEVKEPSEVLAVSEAKKEMIEKVQTKKFEVKISAALQKKLKEQSEEEGISLEQYVSELLTEGAVMRAWDIIARNSQRSRPHSQFDRDTRGGNMHHGHNRQGMGGGHGRHNQEQRGGKRQGGMSHSRYQNIMEDKNSFMEYVKGLDKKRR